MSTIDNAADLQYIQMIAAIIEYGTMDENPRPHYEDGTPAHTYYLNHMSQKFDLDKGELPLISLRPIALKSAIGEMLWIYQDESNSLDLLKYKYGVTWWDSWDIGDRTIGACYGETVRRHNLMRRLIEGLEKDPFGRRHIINLWQEEDFKDPHGLKPCAYETIWNVRRKDGEMYLDMVLNQRSSDYLTAGCINQMQYVVLQMLVANHLGYKPGWFTWHCANVHIYDRHLQNAAILLQRQSVEMNPAITIKAGKHDFWSITRDDIKVTGYPIQKIREQNPQLKFELGI